MIRVRFLHVPGATLHYSIERLADSLAFDFEDGTFKVTALNQPTAPILADKGLYAGRYRADLDTPVDVFTDGEYLVTIHEGDRLVGLLTTTLIAGDDLPPPLTIPLRTLIQLPVRLHG